MAASSLDRLLAAHPLPPGIDAQAIRRDWLALGPPFLVAERHQPLPTWARRTFTESGRQAWQVLRRDVPAIDPARPLSVYIHVPFCAQRCAFCDCYSFRLGAHRERHVQAYGDLLAAEIRAWSGLGSLAHRPLTTVHLGGGTPLFLGLGPLENMVTLLRQHLAAGPETEWALESTASDLTPATLAGLDSLGFGRLHVGVQSLDNGVRRAIGRQLPAAGVLAAIDRAVARGWVVSVDLIARLPGQSLAGMLDDIAALAAAGVDGFSVYELQFTRSNQAFARRHGLDDESRVESYLFFLVARQFLASLGYHPTLYNHFARSRDTNLYFTFPERSEDLLALGTIADGRFGDYHYRHPAYATYCRWVREDFPGLQGGLRSNALENRLEPLVTALMAGRVARPLLQALAGPELAGLWQELQLLAPASPEGGGEDLHLTGSGSWFVGNMISQLLRSAAAAGQDVHGAAGGR